MFLEILGLLTGKSIIKNINKGAEILQNLSDEEILELENSFENLEENS